MEPERKIEKLLRASANQRRKAAGKAFELHPATRRLLQGEVARQQTEAPQAAAASFSFWQWLRQRWLVPASLTVAILVGTLLLWPIFPTAKMQSPTVLALNQSPKDEMAAPTAAADRNGKLAEAFSVSQAKDNPAPATALAVKTGSTGLMTKSRVQATDADKFAATGRPSPALRLAAAERAKIAPATVASTSVAANRPAPAAAPGEGAGSPAHDARALGLAGNANGGVRFKDAAAAPEAGSVADHQPTAQNRLAFQTFGRAEPAPLSQNNISNSQRFTQTVAPATKPPVLASFEFQQNGNAVVIVDRDGSVYQGSLQPEPTNVQNAAGASGQQVAAVTPAVNQVANNASLAQNMAFRVAGQNRTSKQNVVFAGNLMQSAPAMGQMQSAAQKDLRPATDGQAAGWFANSRITGTVTVDATNQMEIDATPVLP